MKKIMEICVLSGKGGTGKTTFTSLLYHRFSQSVFTDCDVDAANLALCIDHFNTASQEFIGGFKAEIIEKNCQECGKCNKACAFEAITADFKVIPYKCEGCGVCLHVCPHQAVKFAPAVSGTVMHSDIPGSGKFIHAELIPGEQNSGKLVTRVRNEALKSARESGKDLIIIDGPPGIGCPVIASLSGVSLFVAVTEPTFSGKHDLQRVVELAQHFQIPGCVLVNRADVNSQITEEIRNFCIEKSLYYLGEVPFDSAISISLREGKPLHTLKDSSPAVKSFEKAIDSLSQIVDKIRSQEEK